MSTDAVEVDQLIVMGEKLPSDRIEELLTTARAVVQPSFGTHSTMVMSTASADVGEGYCPNGDDCVHYLMTLLGRVPICHLEATYLAHCLVTAQSGGIRELAGSFLRHQESLPEGISTAGGYLLGNGPADLVFEVAGEDLDAVVRTVLELTDHLAVASVDQHLTFGTDRHVRG